MAATTINTNFDKQSYSSANKPSSATCKGDISNIESAINNHASLIDANATSVYVNSINNYQITATIASDQLTVALKDIDGSDATTSSPVRITVTDAILSLTSALSVTLDDSDLFGWASGKIQGNDAQLFVYAINNNGTLQIGVSPDPSLTTVATNYYDAGGQTGSAGHSNIIMSGTINATNSCKVIGRINVKQDTDNDWISPGTSKVINYPILMTDWLNWSPTYSGAGTLTYTSVTATTRYRVDGEMCSLIISATGTVANGSNNISVTAPITRASGAALAGTIEESGTGFREAGFCYLGGSPTIIYIGPNNNGNWNNGTGSVVVINGSYNV